MLVNMYVHLHKYVRRATYVLLNASGDLTMDNHFLCLHLLFVRIYVSEELTVKNYPCTEQH